MFRWIAVSSINLFEYFSILLPICLCSFVVFCGLFYHINGWSRIFFWTIRSVFYPATDVVVLKFMVEVCWAPMLAAFSVPLDQSDDEIVISQCLEGFRSAIHVTAAMSMKTQRDAFITSLAKFTSLHSAADIRQKNVEAIKVCSVYWDEHYPSS